MFYTRKAAMCFLHGKNEAEKFLASNYQG